MARKKKDDAKTLILKYKERNPRAINLPLLETLQKISNFARYDASVERLNDFSSGGVGILNLFGKWDALDEALQTLINFFKVEVKINTLEKSDIKNHRQNRSYSISYDNAITDHLEKMDAISDAILKEREEATTKLVALLGEMYKDEGNPFYVSYAINVCDTAALPVPDWCLGDIKTRAARLMHSMREGRAPQARTIIKIWAFPARDVTLF